MQAILATALKALGGVLLNMLLGLLLSPAYVYKLVVRGLRVLVGVTSTSVDDEVLADAEKTWESEGLGTSSPKLPDPPK